MLFARSLSGSKCRVEDPEACRNRTGAEHPSTSVVGIGDLRTTRSEGRQRRLDWIPPGYKNFQRRLTELLVHRAARPPNDV